MRRWWFNIEIAGSWQILREIRRLSASLGAARFPARLRPGTTRTTRQPSAQPRPHKGEKRRKTRRICHERRNPLLKRDWHRPGRIVILSERKRVEGSRAAPACEMSILV